LKQVLDHAISLGAKRARVESGLIANPGLDRFLADRVLDGKKIFGGSVKRSNIPKSDFVIEFDLVN
jgi:hypothetical protein